MKKVLSFALFMCLSSILFSQGFFKPVNLKDPNSGKNIRLTGSTATDSTFFAPRPVTGVAYSFPNNQAMAIAGLSIQNITYNYETKRSYVNFSFDALYGLGATANDQVYDTQASSFGFGIYALNRTVGVVCVWNKMKKKDPLNPDEPMRFKPQIGVSWGINLN